MLKMTPKILLAAITLLLLNCTGRDITDTFRKKQYRNMDHVQRKLKKAVTEAEQKEPSLIDTTTHTKDSSFSVSSGFNTKATAITTRLADSTSKSILMLIDTVRHTIHDTTHVPIFIQDTIRSAVRKAFKKQQKEIEDDCTGITIKDTLKYKDGAATVWIWQDGKKLRVKLASKSDIIKNCPECANTWRNRGEGAIGTFLFLLFLLLAIAYIVKAFKK